MGYRTVVILFNDDAHKWENDPQLGKKIMAASNLRGMERDLSMGYGRVVESCHADQQTLGIIDSYNFKPLSFGQWRQNETDAQMQEKLLAEAADKLGFRLVKKTAK